MLGYKRVTQKHDLPTGKHYAVLVYSSVTTPGYDAYDPPGSQNIVEYISFDNAEELKKWIERTENQKYSVTKYSIIESTPVKANISININLQ